MMIYVKINIEDGQLELVGSSPKALSQEILFNVEGTLDQLKHGIRRGNQDLNYEVSVSHE